MQLDSNITALVYDSIHWEKLAFILKDDEDCVIEQLFGHSNHFDMWLLKFSHCVFLVIIGLIISLSDHNSQSHLLVLGWIKALRPFPLVDLVCLCPL